MGNGYKICRSSYELPERGLKHIIAVINHKPLINILKDIAKEEQAQLCLARPNTPDIIAMSGNLRIVNRQYLGKRSWNNFCEFIKQTNQTMDYPLLDDGGGLIIDEFYIDDTPLLIVDENNEKINHNFSKLENMIGEVYFINKNSTDLIAALVKKILKNNSPRGGMVRAVFEDERKRLKNNN